MSHVAAAMAWWLTVAGTEGVRSGRVCGNEGGASTSICSLPPWPATYQMNASTIIMPCNYTGYQVPSTIAGWGIVDFDWSNDLAGWSGATPMNNDERQLIQVKMIKEDPATADYTKVWIYRNMVYAYPWFTQVRKILDDPAYAPWFMMFSGKGNYTSPDCDNDYDPPLCTKYFHTQMDTPKPNVSYGSGGHPIGGYGRCTTKGKDSGCDCGTKPCGFYVYNHSSTAVINGQTFQEWWLDSYIFNEVGSSKLVHGFYWDDTWYPGGVGDDPEAGMIQDMGLTKDDLLQLTASFDKNMMALRNRTLKEGKFAWQLMTSEHVDANPGKCKASLEKYCKPDAAPQTEAMYYPAARPPPPPGAAPKHAFTNCSVFGCTCKGAADYYGIGPGFGCADQGAQQWWIHEAKPCASPSSCCTAGDYTKKSPPYPGCSNGSPPVPKAEVSVDLACGGPAQNLKALFTLFVTCSGHGWQGCGQPLAEEGGGYPFPQEYHTDFGTPQGLCSEGGGSSSAVFTREYTKATVKMDCNTGKPTITMK